MRFCRNFLPPVRYEPRSARRRNSVRAIFKKHRQESEWRWLLESNYLFELHFSLIAMKIGIIGSMQFTDKMIETQAKLKELGHDAFLSDLHKAMIGKTSAEIEKIKLRQKYTEDAIRKFWRMMQGADAVLALNYDKNGIKNYVGGNTLMEIGFAHVLNQKIFLLHPIPEMQYCKTEIEAVKPIILHGDLTKIK